MKNKINKRGDIPITILVLGVVLVCMATIVSFYISSQKVNKDFDIEIVKEIKLIKEKIDLYKNLGWSQGEIDSVLGIKSDEQGRYILLSRGSISARYALPR